MNYWDRFLSKQNFLLSWRRINTGSNAYYKRFFRKTFIAYEISLENNISSLIERIKSGSYTPKKPERIFIPKPSGLQRPITLLSVEDQIIWQALANFLQRKCRVRRDKVEERVVYSNLYNPNEIFFFKSWKICYRNFQNKIKEVYENRKWVVNFDLAAFYDTISHDHILKLVNPRDLNSDICVFIKEILHAWSAEKSTHTFSHGIPQGPIASSCISELILLDIDIKIMQYQDNFSYLRYVDDIRLFAKDEDRVRRGLVILEQLCRNKGLIPQSRKTDIFYAKNEEDAIGKHFSLSPEEMNFSSSENLLLDSINMEKNEIEDESKFKFFLYRGEPLKKHLNIIFKLFEKYPHLSDAFVTYFRRFVNNEEVITFFEALVKRKKFPYQYVEGNVWFLLSEVNTERNNWEVIEIAKKKLFEKNLCIFFKFGLMTYLAPFVDQMERKIFYKYSYCDSAILQSMLLPYVSMYFNKEQYIDFLKICLIRTKPEAGLCAVVQMANDNIKFRGLKVANKINQITRNCLLALGLTTSRYIPKISPFQEIFEIRYKIQISNWELHFNKDDYKHIHKIFILSFKSFDINRSQWLCYSDSANEIITRTIIDNDLVLIQKTIGSNGRLVSFGSLLDKGTPFSKKYFLVADAFREVHIRRCFLPDAHPYDIKTKKRTQLLKRGEQKYYYGKLKKAYIEVDKIIKNL